jgi:hypothetical protein
MRLGLVVSFVVWACVSNVLAQGHVWERSWSSLKETNELGVGEIQQGGPFQPPEQLKIDNPTSEPKTVKLLDLQHPNITKFHYALEGSVRYENVKGKSYLEMWSWFADGNMCFSRTLGDSGPMQFLKGSSEWRPFSLPFFSNAESGTPTRIVVNLVFADKGTIYLSPLKLVQYQGDHDEVPIQRQAGWWSEQDARWIGAVGGVLLGLLGGLVGSLGGCGKARRFVLALCAISAVLGAASLVLGLIAMFLRQPYEVCFPLLMVGVLAPGVMGPMFFLMRWAYQQRELRKMAAMDAAVVNY